MMNIFFSAINGGGMGGATPIVPPSKLYDYDLFIDAGQSNIDGRNVFSERPSFILSDGKVPNCKMWNGSQFEDWQLGVNSGLIVPASTDWSFDCVCHYNISQSLSITPFIIKRSEGGTAIEPNITTKGCWNVNFASIPSGEKILLQELEIKINAAKTYLDSIGKTYKFRGLIWHQGEADEYTIDGRNNYYQNFKAVISYIRGIVSDPLMPVIFGMIPNASASYNLTIRNAQIQIDNEDANAYLVDLSDLTLQDAWHFDSASSIVAGERYADVFINNNL